MDNEIMSDQDRYEYEIDRQYLIVDEAIETIVSTLRAHGMKEKAEQMEQVLRELTGCKRI